MSHDAFARLVASLAQPEPFSWSAWLREKPVRRSRLVAWLFQNMVNNGDEMVSALALACRLMDDPNRQQIIDELREANRAAEALGLEIER